MINYQYDFLVNNNTNAWHKMWELSYILSGKLLTTLCRQMKFGMPSERFEEVKIEAVYRVLRRYKKKTGYYIRSSFAYELRMAQLQIICGETKAQKCIRIATTEYKDLPLSEALYAAKLQMENENND